METLTTHDILPGSGSGIITDGGTITIKTGGVFSNQDVVSSSGVGAGRDAGDITIIAGSIDVRADLLAVGSNGSTAVLPGQDGGNGGKGGRITLEGTGGIAINANIQADAGNGGNGGKADDATIGVVALADEVATAAWREPSASRPRTLPSPRLQNS